MHRIKLSISLLLIALLPVKAQRPKKPNSSEIFTKHRNGIIQIARCHFPQSTPGSNRISFPAQIPPIPIYFNLFQMVLHIQPEILLNLVLVGSMSPLLALFFFFFMNSRAQTSVSHEVGGFFGIAAFQTDMGLSTEFAAENQSNMGFGIAYYLKFFGSQYNWRSGSSFFSEHFKLKAEFAYINNSNINFEGEVGASMQPIVDAMKASVKLYNVGLNLEYYIFQLE